MIKGRFSELGRALNVEPNSTRHAQVTSGWTALQGNGCWALVPQSHNICFLTQQNQSKDSYYVFFFVSSVVFTCPTGTAPMIIIANL